MPASNAFESIYDTLQNCKQNGVILEAMTSVTDVDGNIAELTVATAAESNMMDVFMGTVNHFKVAHAKKILILDYVKGATAADDSFVYSIIVKYNNTNSGTLSTVLSKLDLSAFVKIADADRDATDSGELPNSNNISVSWDLVSAKSDLSTYLTAHQLFHNAINDAIVACKPFVK